LFETESNKPDQDHLNQADKVLKPPKAYWKKVISRVPVLGGMARWIYGALRSTNETKPEPFPGSAEYWEKRYSTAGDSGVGSYGFFAEFKADVLNHFVFTHDIQTVIEFGCGGGNQLSLATYPKYLGFDVSSTVLEKCPRGSHQKRPTGVRSNPANGCGPELGSFSPFSPGPASPFSCASFLARISGCDRGVAGGRAWR
jgi:hypothetical protein